MSGIDPRLNVGSEPLDVDTTALVPVLIPLRDDSTSPLTPPTPENVPPADLPDEGVYELPQLVSIGDIFQDSPPWLVSAVFHILIVIILGLIVIDPRLPSEFLLHFDSVESEVPIAGELYLPVGVPEGIVDGALGPQADFDVTDATNDISLQDPLLPSDAITGEVEPIRLALSGREAGMQQALLGAYGGTGGTQNAVMEALKWLARNQQRKGMWSLRGPYENGANNENQEAATAMALIAFQGAGYTPKSERDSPFVEVVGKGWTALLAKQDASGNFFQSGQGTSQLYTQALCTIALCELYGMTRDERYRKPAQLAISYCVDIQAPEGGWRYFPGSGSDLSVTGWFVMALQSARMAGLEVPSTTLLKVDEFLDSVSFEYGSRYAYQTGSAASRSMTAEGLLCRQYLGWRRDDDRLVRGADYLLDHLPDWTRSERDVYYWYYATQVCHHMEGQRWQAWNNVMRDLLPKHQVKEGRERGSWDPEGFRWDTEGGRLFITCLSTYMLEVYYRHLPIYQQSLIGGL